jgi:hypothetical protein
MTAEELDHLSYDAAIEIAGTLAKHHPLVQFLALMKALVVVMGDNSTRTGTMVRIISELDWIKAIKDLRKLIDDGADPALTREPPNYQ